MDKYQMLLSPPPLFVVDVATVSRLLVSVPFGRDERHSSYEGSEVSLPRMGPAGDRRAGRADQYASSPGAPLGTRRTARLMLIRGSPGESCDVSSSVSPNSVTVGSSYLLSRAEALRCSVHDTKCWAHDDVKSKHDYSRNAL